MRFPPATLLIALCHSRQQAEQVQARLTGWLGPRGLAFNQDKTKITHLDQGVDFLGFEIRRFGGKLLTKPSKEALRQIRNRLSAEVTALRGANADAVTGRLNPIITGWAAYYRIGVSSLAYNRLDAHVWRLTWKWARHTHPDKPRHWVVSRYFGMFNPSRNDKWLFGSRDTGHYLRRFSWTKIVRHTLVAGRASPDDPALAGYWAKRRERTRPPVSPATWHLLRRQHGRCPPLPGAAALRQPRPSRRARVGAVARHHPQGRPQAGGRHRDGPRHARRASRIPPHPRPLPPTHRQQGQHFRTARSHRACLSRAAEKVRTAGSEGAGVQQCTPATRRARGHLPRAAPHPPAGPHPALRRPRRLRQEAWALLALYQALRTAITDAVQSVPGTDPDRASYQVAIDTAQDLLITARNITDPGGDLAGDIGRAVLARLNPPRRPRVCPRRVKSPLSRWNKHPPGKPTTSKKITQITSQAIPADHERVTRRPKSVTTTGGP